VYPRNAASPEPIAIGAVVQISDGAVQTSGCTVRIKPIGVAEGDGAGATAYSTDGIVLYTPTQAETNYTSFILVAKKTGCIPVAITVVTSASGTAGYAGVDWSKVTAPTTTLGLSGTTIKAVTDAVALPATATIDITGNITGNLSGSVGSVTGAVGSVTGSVGSISGVTFPANFGALGINASGHVSRVTLTDTLTTYTGNTPQTGDSFAYLGTNVGLLGANASALASAANLATVATYAGEVHKATVAAATVTVAASPSPSTTIFGTNRTEADNFWNDARIKFTSGALGGQSRVVLDYANASGTFTLDEPLTATPSAGDTFILVSDHLHSITQIQSGLATSTALATAQSDLDTLTGADGATLATLQPNYAPYTGTPPTAIQIRTEIDSNSTQLAAILADTNELQVDWVNGGRLDLILDARASQTSVDDVPTNAELATALGTADDATLAAIAALNNISTANVATSVTTALTTALTEGYRATNATGSVRDMLYELIAHMGEMAIVDITKTTKKVDGTTTAKTYTLNDATTPTSITEAT
jgi:hypothetical protein